jgi:GNAT superfamily N-acetyltransferase
MLQTLRRQGFVQGEASKHDARQVRLSLSAKGRKAFAALDDGSRRATAEMLAPLPGAHRRRLMQAMHTVQHVLQPQSTTGEVTLRAHRPGDMGWVVERHGVLYEREYGWGALFEALVADIVAKFLREFDAKRERCWIAERAGERVGSAFVVKENRASAKLRLLLIEPEVRGTGLGKRLVQECVAFARGAGYRKLVLWTHANLAAARAIYAKLGFRMVKREPHRQFGVPVVGEYWELEL